MLKTLSKEAFFVLQKKSFIIHEGKFKIKKDGFYKM